jgi:FkbM family methyltransferase
MGKMLAGSLICLLGAALARLAPSEIEDLAGQVRALGLRPKQEEALRILVQELAKPPPAERYRMELNGERHLLERTAAFGFATLFDVGANQGGWARAARAAHPRATIHCFEILPATFELLRAATRDLEGLVLNPFGLSDRNAEVEVFATPNTAISSLLDFGYDGARRQRCQVRRGADYAAEHGIERLDLLKIDTEGAESLVLEGFRPMLEAGRVRVIQFEYNRGAIEARFLLRDFYRFFGPLGYRVGKLTAQGVLFRDYHHSQEDFVGPNYCAVHAGETALIEALSGKA